MGATQPDKGILGKLPPRSNRSAKTAQRWPKPQLCRDGQAEQLLPSQDLAHPFLEIVHRGATHIHQGALDAAAVGEGWLEIGRAHV